MALDSCRPLTGGDGYMGVWTGSEVLIWGVGGSTSKPRAEMAAFDPEAGRWEQLDPGPLGIRYQALTAYTGTEFLVWGGVIGHEDDLQYLSDGAAYDATTRQWRGIASAPIEGRPFMSGVWTEKDLLRVVQD